MGRWGDPRVQLQRKLKYTARKDTLATDRIRGRGGEGKGVGRKELHCYITLCLSFGQYYGLNVALCPTGSGTEHLVPRWPASVV